jgi:hypothetical protein
MNELMAIGAKRCSSFIHFFSGKIFFEPFIGMAGFRNEMMKSQFPFSTTHFANFDFYILIHFSTLERGNRQCHIVPLDILLTTGIIFFVG